MKKATHILIVEDTAADAELAQRVIGKTLKGCIFHVVETRQDFLQALETFQPDVILSDYALPRFDGLTTLTLARTYAPLTPLIIWTGSNSEDVAVDCMKAGASNYVLKENMKRLGPAVIHALEERELLLAHQQAEEKYQSIFENSIDGIFQSTPQGHYLNLNPAMARIYGYDTPTQMRESVKDIATQIHVDPDSRSEFVSLLHAHNQIQNFEARNYRRDGSIIWTSTSARTVCDAQGKVLYYEGFIQDITQRKKAEEALQYNEKRFRALIENGLDDISLLAVDGTLLWESPSTIRNLGYEPDEFVGRSMFELLHPEDLEQTRQVLARLIQVPGDRQYGTFRLRRSDGTWRWVEAIGTNLLNEPGINAIVVNYRDITAQKQTEIELQQKNTDLTLVNALNELINRGNALDVVVDLLRNELKRIFSSEYTNIYLLDPDEQSIQMQQYSLPPEVKRKIEKLIGRAIPAIKIPVQKHGFFQRVLHSGRGMVISGPEMTQQWIREFIETTSFSPIIKAAIHKVVPQIYKVLNIKSTILVPLISDGKVLGLLNVSSPNLFTEQDLERIENICGQLTTALRRKQVEEALRESQANYQNLVETSHDLIWSVDAEGRITFLNYAAKEIYGYEPEALLGLPYTEIIDQGNNHPLEFETIEEMIGEANEFKGVESQVCHRDGRVIILSANSIVQRDQDGKLTGITGTSRDITEQKRVEEMLREERNLLRTLIDNLPDRIYAMDSDGRKTLSNTADWQASGGKTMEDVIGKTDFDTYPPDLAEGFWQLDKAVLESGQAVINYEEPGLDAEGNRVSILTSKIPLHDDKGNVIGLVGIGRDITEQKQIEERINDLLALNEKILNHSAVGILSYKVSGPCIFANEKAASIVGTTVAQLLTQNFHTIETWKKSGLYDLVQQAISTQASTTADIHHTSTFGKDVWLTVNCITFKSKGEEHVLLSISDITERKQAEEKLRQSENRYRLAIKATNDVIWESNLQTKQLYWSENAQIVFGYTPEEVASYETWWDDHVHPDDRERVLSKIDSLIEGDESLWMEEYRFLLKDGSYAYVSDRGYIERDNSGMPLRMIGAMTDITERKRAEEALHESENRLVLALSGAQMSVWEWDLQTNQILWSPEFFKITGMNEDQFTGTFESFADLIHSNDAARVRIAAEKAIRDQTLFAEEFRIICPDGEVRWLSNLGRAEYDSPGRHLRLIGTVQDVTQRKQAEIERQALLEIMQGLAETEDLHELLKLIHRSIAQMIYSENFFVILHHQNTGLFEEIYSVDQYDPPAPPDKLENSITSYVFRSGEPLLLTQVLFDELVKQGEMKLVGTNSASWLGVPLKTSGRTIGVMAVQDYEVDNRYTERDKHFLASIAAQVALVIERKQAEEALRESEEHYRAIFEGVQDAIFVESLDGKILMVNERACEMFGYSQAEFLTKTVSDIVPEGQMILTADGETSLLSAEPQETLNRRADGEIFPIDISGRLQVINGETVLLVVVRDVTERKKAEKLLQESEDRFSSAFEYASIGMALVSPEGRWLRVNWALCELVGYSEAELMQKTFQDITYQDDLEKDVDYVQQVLAGEIDSYEMEKRYVHKTGKVIWVLLNVSLVRDNEGKPLYFISQIQDISERKEAEDVLHRSEALYRQAIEVAGAVPYYETYYDEGRSIKYEFIGEGIRQITGYRSAEFNAALWDSLVEEISLVGDLAGYSLEEAIRRVRAGENSIWQCEHRLRDRDGNIHWVFEAAVELRDENGISYGSIGTYQDITERKQAEESLRAEREKMQNYLDIAGVIMLALDREGTVTLINQKGCEILGVSADQIIGKNWINTFLPESDREDLKEVFQQLISGDIRAAEYYENAVLTKHGEKRLIAWHNTSVRDEHRKIISILSSGEDITERKRSEEALREAETKYRTLVEQLPSVTYLDVMDDSIRMGQFNTSYISPQVENLLGYSPHAFQTDPGLWVQLIHPDDRERVLARISEYYTNQGFYNDEYRMQTREGDEIWVRDEAIVVRGKENQRSFSQGVIFDITERKRAETALVESNAKFRALFEASPDAILLIDPNNEWPIIDCNTAACQLNGYTREELVGQSIDILNLTAGQPNERRSYLEKIRQTGVLRLETVHRHKDGGIIPVEVSTSLIKLGGRDVILGIDRDVTERKRMEVAEGEQRALAEALRDTAEILSSTLDYGEVLDHILAAVGRVVPHEAATIMLIEDGYAHVVRSHGYDKHNFNVEIMGIRLSVSETTNLRQMIETRQPVVVYDTHAYPRWHRMPATDWLRSSVGAPISIYGEMIGFICLDNQAPEFFTPVHAERLEAFANQAALAIHNARLLQQAQEEITERKRAEEALRFEKERLEKIAAAVPGVIGSLRLRSDGSGCMPFASPAVQDVYGFLPKDLEHDVTPFFARIHPEDLLQVTASINESAQTMLPWHHEFRYDHPDRGEIWIEGQSMPIREEDGIIWHGFAYDISERKRAEEELRASEERFRQLADNIQEVFWMTDAQTGQEIYMSPAAEAIWGQTLEILMHEPNAFINSVFPEDQPRVLQNIEKEINGEKVEMEYRIVRPDGSLRWIWDRAFPIFDDSGKVKRIAGISADITERRESELALVKSQSRYRELFDSSPVSIWEEDFALVKKRVDNLLSTGVTDLREYFSTHPEDIKELASLVKITDVNQASMDLYGVEEKQELLTGLTQALGEDTLAHFPEEILGFLGPEKRFVWEGTEKVFDGKHVELVVTGSIPHGYEEDWSKVIVSLVDITERKQAEEGLRESEARYHGLFQNLVDGFALHQIITDDQGQPIDYIFLEVNPSFEKLTGLIAAEIIGRRVTEVLPGVENERFIPIYGQVALTGQPVHFDEYSVPLGRYFEINAYSPRRGQFAVTFVDVTERKQAEMEIRRRAEETSILLKTSLALTNLDLKATLQTVGDSTKNLFGADGCRIFLMEPDGKILRCVLALQESLAAFSDLRVRIGEGVTGAVAASGVSEIVNDMQNDTRALQVAGTPEEQEAIMFAPLKERDNTIGVLSVRRVGGDRPFQPSDLALLEALASMAASAVSNARLFAETQRRLSELEALYENGLAVGRLLKPSEIGKRLIHTFARYLPWHHVTIRLRQDVSDTLELVAFSLPNLEEDERTNAEQHFTARISKVGQGLSGWVIQTGEPLRTGNVHAHSQYIDTHAGIQSGLYMPLKVGERVIGVITVESELPDAFTEQDERLLATLASQAAIAFENARLYQEIEQELSERKRAQEALLSSETHYRELADSITDILFELDRNLCYTHWNKASEILTGVSAKDAIAKPMHEVFGESEEQHRIRKIYEEVLEDHEPKTFETTLMLNGERRSFEINAYPSTRGVSVVAKDVTDRKRAEIIMQKRFELMEYSAHHGLDELMQRTVDEMSELTGSIIGFFHFVQEDQKMLGVQTWSTRTLELCDVAVSEGKHLGLDQAGVWAQAVHQRRSLIQNDYDALPEKRGFPQSHVPITREIVIPIIRNERVMAITGIGNKPQEYTLYDLEIAERLADYAWDVIERKQMQVALEAERNQLAKRVEERTSDLSQANSNLARALRVKDEFLANMSHELRTPLNAILGLSESLGEQIAGPLNEKQQKYITTISESGHHLLSLINDILDLAKIEAGQITLDINKVDVYQVCQASLRMIKQLAQKKNQDIVLEIGEGIGLMWADERRLKQMMVNLLGNAVKFTPENGKIGLEVHGDQVANKVTITIWDNGIGIKEDDLARLFQPFVQLDSGLAREATGTGLGLALVAQMARLHGGSVSAMSDPGKGSRFAIILPWEPALAMDNASRLRTTGKFRAIRPDETNKPTILLVEDTKEVVMMLQDYLELAGYKVVTARDGVEAISQARLVHPDLILMDVMMPRLDGFEATRKLRSEPEFKYTPIIALTALAMPSDRERCLAAGMDEYISKPINLKALVRVVQSCLVNSKELRQR